MVQVDNIIVSYDINCFSRRSWRVTYVDFIDYKKFGSNLKQLFQLCIYNVVFPKLIVAIENTA